MRGPNKNGTNIVNSWDNIKVKAGKLTGGMLTDELAKDIYPSNYMKFNHTGGFEVVRTKSINGNKTPVRNH